MRYDPERKMAGLLSVNIWCTNECTAVDGDDSDKAIEKRLLELLGGVFYTGGDNSTVCAVWNRSNAFAFDGNRIILQNSTPEVFGITMLFDLLEFPEQTSTTPDPVTSANTWLNDPAVSELLILEGTAQLERLTFANADGEDNITALIAAFRKRGSAYYNLTKITDSAEAIATVDQEKIEGGSDPVINVAAYSAAFEALEPHRWSVLSIDTDDAATQLLMQMFLNRAYLSGKFCMGVTGKPTTADFETRLTDAAELTEPLTNNQYERAIQSGMLTFSISSRNKVWVDSGVNTLTSPVENDDEGWKKIKRVKVRFELFQRLNDITEPLVGRINNDPDGRMTIIQKGNGVCNAMVAERKLLAGAHIENDPENLPEGDSAWFLVFADDIDAFEKGYFKFQFRFAPDNNN